MAQSIASVGLLHPIVITPDNTLIAGRRRMEACKSLGWDEIPVTVLDISAIVRGEFDENTLHKDFTPSEQVAIADAIEAYEREAAKKRQQEHGKTAPGRHKITGANLAPVIPTGKVRDHVAKAAGTGRTTLQRARAVVEAAKAEPQKFQPLQEEMDRTGRVNGVYKKFVRQKQAEEIAKEPPPLPVGPFRVIVIDPPWTYENRAEDTSHRAANPYPSMTREEIMALPVADRATSNAVAWLWTTNAHLREAFTIVEEWGFEYKTLLTWVKDRMGTGDWLRGQTEHCLVAVRGKPAWNLSNQTTVIHGVLREHSRKPEEFYQLVDALCPGSKLEMFGRQQRPGWTVHGSEAERFSA
jgi:N6-adenosine-specific RNA methylase IME4